MADVHVGCRLKRLREGQDVWLCGAHRDGPSRQCTVLAVYRASVALRSLAEPLADRGGPPTEYFLVFEHEERPIALRGEVDVRGDDLRFRTTDGVVVAQPAAPRLARSVPIELVATDRPYAEPVQGETASYSADGVLLQDAGDLRPGEPVRFTFAPAPGLTVTGRGEVLPITSGRLAVAFVGLDPALRDRIVEHVIEHKRDAAGRIRPAAPAAPAG